MKRYIINIDTSVRDLSLTEYKNERAKLRSIFGRLTRHYSTYESAKRAEDRLWQIKLDVQNSNAIFRDDARCCTIEIKILSEVQS